MQHDFAASNGVLAAFTARADYTGIERVLERSYGGFLTVFSSGLASLPADGSVSPFESLGTDWEVEEILITPHALMAAIHAPTDRIRLLQDKYKTIFQNVADIKNIRVQTGGTALKKGGWKIETHEVEQSWTSRITVCGSKKESVNMRPFAKALMRQFAHVAHICEANFYILQQRVILLLYIWLDLLLLLLLYATSR